MTSDTALVLAGIIGAFVLFGVTLGLTAIWSSRGPASQKAKAQDASADRRAA